MYGMNVPEVFNEEYDYAEKRGENDRLGLDSVQKCHYRNI